LRSNDQPDQTSWSLPSEEEVLEALRSRDEQREKHVVRTIQLKIHNPSRRKTQELLAAHVYVTNLTARCLQEWREDPTRSRLDGAFAGVANVASKKGTPSRYLAAILGARFKKKLTEDDYYFSSQIREGVYLSCARTEYRFVQNVIKASGLPKAGQDLTLDAAQIHETWRQQWAFYSQIEEMPIPFGRYKDQPLKTIRKREARWLLKRLAMVDTIDLMLAQVEELLSPTSWTATETAAVAPHPYKRTFRHQRSVRINHLMSRILDPHIDPILLGLLHKDELLRLRDELREIRNLNTIDTEVLTQLRDVLQEAQQDADNLDGFKVALETLIYKRPPSYPEVQEVCLDEEHIAEAEATYEARLNWFGPNPKHRDFDKYRFEDREAHARDRLLRAANALTPPTLQPLSFIRTMRPGTNSGSALLYDAETFEFVFAIKLYGRNGPKDRVPRIRENLYYVNFPETRFSPSKTEAFMLFPLEYSQKYEQMLVKIVEQQRTVQRLLHELRASAGDMPEKSLEECLPQVVPLRFARLVCHWHDHDKPEFYLHLSVVESPPEIKPRLQGVIGFHEHDHGYSYAVLGPDGRLRSVGDVAIPRHVDPRYGAVPSDNCAFEIVKAMLSLSQPEPSIAYVIGLEDTSWKKRRPGVDRKRNRQIFKRPSRRIATIITYKAALAGLPRPLRIGGVSPAYDCGRCLQRVNKGSRTLSLCWTVICPECRNQQQYKDTPGDLHQTCIVCRYKWLLDEQDLREEKRFTCLQCGAPEIPARYNTAIVVAQRALIKLIERHERAAQDEDEREDVPDE
jgi:hypothetical protein